MVKKNQKTQRIYLENPSSHLAAFQTKANVTIFLHTPQWHFLHTKACKIFFLLPFPTNGRILHTLFCSVICSQNHVLKQSSISPHSFVQLLRIPLSECIIIFLSNVYPIGRHLLFSYKVELAGRWEYLFVFVISVDIALHGAISMQFPCRSKVEFPWPAEGVTKLCLNLFQMHIRKITFHYRFESILCTKMPPFKCISQQVLTNLYNHNYNQDIKYFDVAKSSRIPLPQKTLRSPDPRQALICFPWLFQYSFHP